MLGGDGETNKSEQECCQSERPDRILFHLRVLEVANIIGWIVIDGNYLFRSELDF